MIHVDLQPEPGDFDQNVRQRGQAFLEKCPPPSSDNKRVPGDYWKGKDYWKYCRKTLRDSYAGICAYCGQYIPATMSYAVDHFLPKSEYPELAYEWANFRFASQKMNEYKGTKKIVDPFEIRNGDFVIDFSSFLVKPRENMIEEDRKAVQDTIDILKLNDSEQVNERFQAVRQYVDGDLSKRNLERHYPFVAEELERQKLFDAIRDIMQKSLHYIPKS